MYSHQQKDKLVRVEGMPRRAEEVGVVRAHLVAVDHELGIPRRDARAALARSSAVTVCFWLSIPWCPGLSAALSRARDETSYNVVVYGFARVLLARRGGVSLAGWQSRALRVFHTVG